MPLKLTREHQFRGGGGFHTTHWTTVLAAGRSSLPGCADALEKFCRTYWPPLYGFIHGQGHTSHDAEDLTQSFLAWLLASEHLKVADPERGRFRSFLLVRLKHFLSDHSKWVNAQKRGGGRLLLPLDSRVDEPENLSGQGSIQASDAIFDRSWALLLMERTTTRLREEYATAGRSSLFEELQQFGAGESSIDSYEAVSKKLGVSESAVKSAIHRLRKRHRALLREEVARTVATAAEVDDEIRHLLRALAEIPALEQSSM